MSDPNIENISPNQLQEVVETYVVWASEWDGALLADVFFGVWADMKAERQPLELQARVVEKQLELSAPSESPARVVHNRIFLEDGRS